MIRPVFTAAILTAAFLLFWVQPLFGKMMLPLLGGSPAVWLTAMVFYQGVLLLGYGYAHGLTQFSSRTVQIAVHATLLCCAFLVLPFVVPHDWQPVTDGRNPTLAILSMMTATVGVPLLVLSASSPLLQKWFADTTHANPYPLYAASNVGSLAALLLFPLVIEGLFPVRDQAVGWQAGFGILMGLFAICMLFFVRAGRASSAVPTGETAAAHQGAGISWQQRGVWLVYAFVPSSLLLGVTQYITLDIGAVALLWIVPLVLYLLTFILAFSVNSRISLRTSTLGHLMLTAPLVAAMTVWGVTPSKPLMVLHLGWFFLTALMCHQALFRARPTSAQLTQFYLVVSLGGFLGGVFNALVAPILFSGVWEYMLVITLAMALRPVLMVQSTHESGQVMAATLLMSVGIYFVLRVAGGHLDVALNEATLKEIGFGLFVTVALAFLAARSCNRKHLMVITSCALFLTVINKDLSGSLEQTRSFFGTYKVQEFKNKSGERYHLLLHGTTLHGAQRQDQNRTMPRTYYHPNGPFGAALRAWGQGRPVSVAAIGLGTGALSCYQRPGGSFYVF